MTQQSALCGSPLQDSASALPEISGQLASALAEFVGVAADDLDRVIERSLGILGRAMDMDLATVLLYQREARSYRVDYQWLGDEMADYPGFLGLNIERPFAWLSTKLAERKPFLISSLDDWPVAAEVERQTCEEAGIRSVLWVPFSAGDEIHGYLAYNTVRSERTWDELAVQRLHLFGQIIGSALQRRRQERAIQELVAFERLVADLSSELANLPLETVDRGIEAALQALGEFLGLERVFLVQFTAFSDAAGGPTHGWVAEGVPGPGEGFMTQPFEELFPWVSGVLRQGEILNVRDTNELPPEAVSERRYLLEKGVRSGLLIPLQVGDRIVGGLITDSVNRHRDWPEPLVTRMRMLGQLFGSLLARVRAERNNADHLAFERLIRRISATFINLPPDEIDSQIEAGLQEIGTFLGVDRCFINQFSLDQSELLFTHMWAAAGIPADEPAYGKVLSELFPWYTKRMLSNEPLIFSSLDEFPPEAVAELRYCRSAGIRSSAIVPLTVAGSVTGNFGFDMLQRERQWSEHTVQCLRLAGEIFNSALARKRQWEALHERDELLRATLERAPAGVALADPDGRLVQVNPKFCQLLGYSEQELLQLRVQDFTHPDDWQISSEIIQTLREGREAPAFLDKRYIRKDGSQLWASVYTNRLDAPSGEMRYVAGVIVDISERKAAQLQLERAVDEIEALKHRLEAENTYLRQEIELQHGHDEILGQSRSVRELLQQIEQVAGADSGVLVVGETGTGKELVARAIHRLSPRRSRPMITVNCAALPSSLIEAELFGRERGAYTGALTKQSGRFEAANGSTLFLDEVGELPPDMQSKLLRVLQTGEFERVGSPVTHKVDVRLVAATNRDLAAMVREGRFRQDLFYRLNVFPISVPPLRERSGDIPALVWAFVHEFSERMGKNVEVIRKPSMQALQRYPWPGNVRELRNVIERAMILTRGECLQVELPATDADEADSAWVTLADAERRHIRIMLERCGWRVRGAGGAAERLGLKPSTLESRMKKLGIRRPGSTLRG